MASKIDNMIVASALRWLAWNTTPRDQLPLELQALLDACKVYVKLDKAILNLEEVRKEIELL